MTNKSEDNVNTHEQNVDPLQTLTFTELLDQVYSPRRPVVDGLLYTGTYIFAGAPKVGKSFFMAQLAYHVAMGIPLWNYKVYPGTVLYLALEDDHSRLQRRLSTMFGVDGCDKLFLSVQADTLTGGLESQLKEFITLHPDTRLVIIDTLQKIREAESERFNYGRDYEIMARLKQFSDSYNLCLLLVHHTRKMASEDSFDTISGTNGLLGAADGAFVLSKKARVGAAAQLEIVGRDQNDQVLTLSFNRGCCLWELESEAVELPKNLPDPLLEAVSEVLDGETQCWSGTPAQLSMMLPGIEIAPNVLTRRLNVSAERLYQEYGIRYVHTRTHEGRSIMLTLKDEQP